MDFKWLGDFIGWFSWEGLGNAAVIVTLVAGAVTLLTVVTYFATQPRIELRLHEAGVVGVHNLGRNQPIKNLRMGFSILGTDGQVVKGSDADPWGADILPQTGRWVFLETSDDPAERGERRRDGYIYRLIAAPGCGVIIDFYWQHPWIPWLIRRTVVLSEPAADLRTKTAVKLSKRKGPKVLAERVPGSA